MVVDTMIKAGNPTREIVGELGGRVSAGYVYTRKNSLKTSTGRLYPGAPGM